MDGRVPLLPDNKDNNNNNNELYLHGHKRGLQHCKSILTITKTKLLCLEKRLRKPDVLRSYKEAMNANEINEPEDGPRWYLPHFPVIREDRETTKVRIVFDSAARCKGVSLNDAMLTGP